MPPRLRARLPAAALVVAQASLLFALACAVQTTVAAAAAAAPAAADAVAAAGVRSVPPLATLLPFPLPPAVDALVRRLDAWARANQSEAFLAGIVVLALVNVWLGTMANRRRFLAISDALFAPAHDGNGGGDAAPYDPSSLSFFARHFAGHGHARCANPSLWWRESLNLSVAWASGRRNLDGCLVAVEIRPKQDLLHRLGLAQLAAAMSGGASLEPREGDVLLPGSSGEGLFLDAFVDADAMPWKGVVALGQRSCLRALAKKFPVDVGDLAQAHALDPPAALPYAWPSSDLAVQTDQPALFNALFGSPAVAAILSDPARAALVRRHLRYLHVTSSFPGRNERRVMAEVKLPASSSPLRLRDAEPALELVMAVVDALPTFRQSPEARKRADEARAAANEAHEARMKRRAEEEGGGGGGGGGGRKKGGANTAHEENQRRMMERRQQRLAEERDKARREGRLDEWERQQRLKEQRKMAKKRAVRIG